MGWAAGQGGVGREGVCGTGRGGWVEWEVEKTTSWDTPCAAKTPTQWPMSHQWATQPVGANPGPHYLIGTLHGCHCSDHDFGELEESPSGKVDQLTFNT